MTEKTRETLKLRGKTKMEGRKEGENRKRKKGVPHFKDMCHPVLLLLSSAFEETPSKYDGCFCRPS